jgi:CBS domain-containing protein
VAKQVRDAMTANPRTVLLDASAFEAAKAMEEEDVGSIPVVDSDGILAGMVTDRDITLRVVAARRDPDSTPVSEIASKDISPPIPTSRSTKHSNKWRSDRYADCPSSKTIASSASSPRQTWLKKPKTRRPAT